LTHPWLQINPVKRVTLSVDGALSSILTLVTLQFSPLDMDVSFLPGGASAAFFSWPVLGSQDWNCDFIF
jgi:hypothetical protein